MTKKVKAIEVNTYRNPPSTPFIWRRKHNGPNVLNKFGEKY